jgi:hypothetical protein
MDWDWGSHGLVNRIKTWKKERKIVRKQHQVCRGNKTNNCNQLPSQQTKRKAEADAKNRLPTKKQVLC